MYALLQHWSKLEPCLEHQQKITLLPHTSAVLFDDDTPLDRQDSNNTFIVLR